MEIFNLEGPDQALWDEQSNQMAHNHAGGSWREEMAWNDAEERWKEMATSAKESEPPTKHMIIGTYKFKKLALFAEALIAEPKAFQVEGSGWDVVPDGNLRLALLGQSVLRTMMLAEWYKSGESRVLWHKWFEKTVDSTAYLAKIIKTKRIERMMKPPKLGIDDWSPQSKARTVHALIGAVYEDSGGNLEAVKKFADELGLKKPITVRDLANEVVLLAEATVEMEEAERRHKHSH